MKFYRIVHFFITLVFITSLQAEELTDDIQSNGSTKIIPKENTATRSLKEMQGNRLALVIGNSSYKNSPLKNPVNDARDFASVLRKLGFDVILKTNVSLKEFDQSIDQFGRQLERRKGVGLFFYAGHGVQSKGRNYLIPISADLERETDLKYQSFDAQRIIDEMEYAQNGLNIVVLDACRDNPLTRSFRSGKRGLARFDSTPSGLMLAYSTAPGKQAADGNGRNSPYTTELIKAVQKNNLPLEMVFKDVIKNVKIETKGQQIPWVSSSVDGDFYFSKSVAMSSKSQQATQNFNPLKSSEMSQTKFELIFWETINKNPSQEKYQAYLDKYPNGHFSSIAEYEIRKAKNKNVHSINTNELSSTLNQVKVCDRHLSNKRLTTGKQGNAFSCYTKILSIDPENQSALAGLKKIEVIYLDWANTAISQGEYDKARSYTAKLKLVNPENEEIQTLKQELNLASLEKQEYSSTSNMASPPPLKRNVSSPQKSSPLSVKHSPLLSTISQSLRDALNERDIMLAEGLLAQMKSATPNSRSYRDFQYEYNQLVLQMETEKLYETLIVDALEKKDMQKAENYLNKMAVLTQRGDAYIELKERYDTSLIENKKVSIELTSSVDDNIIMLNGIEKGSTPMTLTLKKGDYLLELKKHGYPSHRLQLALYGNSSHHFELTGGFATGIALENPTEGIEMIAIEPGCFNMGSPSSEAKYAFDEKPHKVCIKKGFWMGKYEITQQQWQAIMKKNPSVFDKCGKDCPVENVEWSEINIFLKHLNSRSNSKYRLPTEAEWEYAARAGTNTPFNTGQCLGKTVANVNTKYKYNKCPKTKSANHKSTVKVGTFPANAWGLYDMHGNVSEWTCSEYNRHYDGTEQKCYSINHSVLSSSGNSQKIAIRGGSWQQKPAIARSAYRDKEFANANNKRMGFRLIREK